jgi:peroxiredoxin
MLKTQDPSAVPNAGQLADATFLDSEGREVRLSSFRGRPILVVFLRHLICLECRGHLNEVAQIRDFLTQRHVEVLAVTFTPPAAVKRINAERPLPFPVVSDPDRHVYRLLELRRASVLSFFRPRVLFKYLREMFRGNGIHKPVDSDMLQLGGDFLIDAVGNVVWSWRCKESFDRPTPEMIRAAIETLSPV